VAKTCSWPLLQSCWWVCDDELTPTITSLIFITQVALSIG
jgi:hypothetical protein